MTLANMFFGFLDNLSIKNSDVISNRYGELTSALNKNFRNTDSRTNNTLQVGSFGRKTGINGISDLDMLYIVPKTKWDDYNTNNGQSKLLKDTKDSILKRYPNTKVKVDRLVVTVTYKDFHVEVQPVFEQDDGSFKYPDTANGGSWKITKPKEEMQAISDMDDDKNKNLRRLCKMVRAWKNRHGVAMGGLLIDTLAYNFLNTTNDFDDKSYIYYDWLSRDFFKYISELPVQGEYSAPGSRQRVKVKKKFQRKAKKAYKLCLDAIDASGKATENDKWKKVYGRSFPTSQKLIMESLGYQNWDNTEEFIEDKFPVDVREYLKIDCEVIQNGFRKFFLSVIGSKRLKTKKDLLFFIKEISTSEPYEIYWKVLNRGDEAKRRNCIRGKVIKGNRKHKERTDFYGDHIVECYCVKNGVVIARDRIYVPISTDGSDYE